MPAYALPAEIPQVEVLRYELPFAARFGESFLNTPRLRSRRGRNALNAVSLAENWARSLDLYLVGEDGEYDAIDFMGYGLFKVKVQRHRDRLSIARFEREEVALDQDYVSAAEPLFDVAAIGTIDGAPALARRYICTPGSRRRLESIARSITLGGEDLPYRKELLKLYQTGW